MKRPPVIVVQLIHIEGPLKGEIQEFPESAISIGHQPAMCASQRILPLSLEKMRTLQGKGTGLSWLTTASMARL